MSRGRGSIERAIEDAFRADPQSGFMIKRVVVSCHPFDPMACAAMAQTRRLAAILAADVAGYSRLIGADESGTLQALRAIRSELIDPTLAAHNGRLVKTTGDGLLVEFVSVVDALRCATEVQAGMLERNAMAPADKRVEYRIGINMGDIVVEDGDIFGDGVNVAARLEGLAEPGGICVSARVQEDVAGKLDAVFRDLGERRLKNIGRPVRVYAICVTAVPPPTPAATATPRLSIVVLPFANLSNDLEQEYFADGITDDLTTDLSRISGSFVIARNTAFTYKGKSVDVRQVGRELGVRYVLEGSVRRSGDQVRVNAQLIEADAGAHVWADRFDTDRANLAEAQDAITGRLARTLNLELFEVVGRRIEQESAIDPDARDLVMRGWALHNRQRSVANNQAAQRALEQALEVDPQSVDPRVGIALVLAASIGDGLSCSVEQDQARAEQLIEEGLERDPNHAMAHYAKGLLRRVQNRLAEAQIEFEMVIALDRNHARAIFQLGQILRYLGQPEAAIPYYQKAIRLNPRDQNIGQLYHGWGASHLLLGHVDEAIDLLRRACAESPQHPYV
jgi:TolB-like protein/class 3 adenylate cyclase/Tfp pilus assembly protein PilF